MDCHVTNTNIFEIPNTISQMTLGRSGIVIVFHLENLLKTFDLFISRAMTLVQFLL